MKVGEVDPYIFKPLSGATPPPSTASYTWLLDFNDEPSPNPPNWLVNYPYFNNITMDVPSGQVVLENYLRARNGQGLVPPNSNFGYANYNFKNGDVLDIVINSVDTGEHPLHLHGHWFW